MSGLDLGFPEKIEAEWLTNRYFPSKVGGKPAWLELEVLPAKEQLLCCNCQKPRAFLCQLYAPYEAEHNFHRTVYVFICRTESCQVANSAAHISVLRSQLPRKNKFYEEVAPLEDGDALPAIPALKKLCATCGCAGPTMCGRCKSTNYCSVAHQRAHWPQHKLVCNENIAPFKEQATKGVVFPEYEIVMERDDNLATDKKVTESKNTKQHETVQLAEYAKLAAEGKTGTLQDIPLAELENYTDTSDGVDDKVFRNFKKATAAEPEQIIRYERGGSPLWIADVKQTVAEQLSSLPHCKKCGGTLQFEFQLMPQMLLLLEDSHLDWGVIAVYTCKESCAIDGYLEEYAVQQDIIKTSDQQ